MIPYIIRAFRGGLSDEDTRGVKGSFKWGYNLNIHKRRDSLSANYGMATIGTSATVTSLIRFAVTARDGSTYTFSDNGRIYSIAGNESDPVVSLKTTDGNGEIKGAAEWQISNGNNYLFWATDTSLATKLLPGDDAWGDTSINTKTDLDSATWHTMKPASGSLLVANNEFLAEYDYSANWDVSKLNIRPGNLIKCLEERDDYVIIGSEKRDTAEEGHIWNWIVTSQLWLQKKKIPVRGVNSLIDTELLLMQGGNEGELFFSDFANTSPLNSARDGGLTNPQGVTIYDDRAVFGIWGSTSTVSPGLYSYGRKMRNRPFAMNLDFRLARTMADSTVSEIGAVWTAHGNLFASWKTTDGSTVEYGIDMLSTTTRVKARYEGLEFNTGLPHLDRTYKSIKVLMEPLPSGCSIALMYKMNRADNFRYAYVADGSGTTYSVANSTVAEFIVNDNGRVYEVGAELFPSGSDTPEINSIVTYIDKGAQAHG